MSDTPLDTSRLQQVHGRLGSHPGGVYADAEGRRWYVKWVESPAHACNERVAAALYGLAGAPTLCYVPTQAPDQVATVWQPLEKKHVSRLDEAERRQARHWLGVHAWTANWDAAGFDGDNQGVAGGRVLTLDVGGALRLRAQGDPKGAAFGPHVGELDTLRRDADNPHAVRLFGDIGRAELLQAIGVVTRLAPAQVRAVVARHGGDAALAETLIARQADMAARAAAEQARPGAAAPLPRWPA